MRSLIFMGVLLLTACGPKATYINGGQGSSTTLEINAMTGSGKVIMTGPFTYCSESIVSKRAPSGALCGALYEEDKPEAKQP